MKSVDLIKLRQSSISELEEKAAHFKNELFISRFALRTGQLADPTKIRTARKAFATIQTIITEHRRRAISSGAA